MNGKMMGWLARTVLLALACAGPGFLAPGSARSGVPPAPAVPPDPAAPAAALDSLVASERAFAALSVRRGMKEAFLAYLADGGVMFHPLPVNGKQMWESRKPNAATLAWEPEFAEVSAAGDLGYTTGPWELRPPAERKDDETAYGHFISIWKRPPGGAWRLAVDLGVSHEKPEAGLGEVRFTAGPVHLLSQAACSTSASGLDAEIGLATHARTIREGYTAAAAPDCRLNRDGRFPAIGRGPAGAALAGEAGWYRYSTLGSGLAASRDLAFTYGLVERLAADSTHAPSSFAVQDSSVYLHVWRCASGQGWKLALAVIHRIGGS
jgi:ketosteroid isomerase-like protein